MQLFYTQHARQQMERREIWLFAFEVGVGGVRVRA